MKVWNNLRYDVVCAGGGASGVFAAVAAARAGSKVLLLERTGFLGGGATLGAPVRGVPGQRTPLMQEFLQILQELGGLGGEPDEDVVPVNGETVKLALFHLCREAGVDVLLACEAQELLVRGGAVAGVCALAKDALLNIETSAVVDATGTGDLARSANALKTPQPMDVYAAMTLTGLNWEAFSGREDREKNRDAVPGAQYERFWLSEDLLCTVSPCVEANRFLMQIPLGCKADPADPASRTRAVTAAHLKTLETFRRLSEKPEFSGVRLSNVPPYLQLRETPEARARGEECRPEQAVAAAADASGAARYYSVSQLALREPSGLLVCGALVAGDELGAAMSTGEAAGACAALAVQAKCVPAQVPADRVRAATCLRL